VEETFLVLFGRKQYLYPEAEGQRSPEPCGVWVRSNAFYSCRFGYFTSLFHFSVYRSGREAAVSF